MEAATVAIDEDSLNDEYLANGFFYTIDRFCESKGSEFNLTDFSNNLSSMIAQALKSVKSLNDIIEKSNFRSQCSDAPGAPNIALIFS